MKRGQSPFDRGQSPFHQEPSPFVIRRNIADEERILCAE